VNIQVTGMLAKAGVTPSISVSGVTVRYGNA
jgi:hypothetical protein